MATATRDTFELPGTTAGLWALCALVPFRSRDACEETAAVSPMEKLANKKDSP